MSSEKLEMQIQFVKILQTAKIDFFRLPNKAFGGMNYKSYAIAEDGRSCDKYFPELIFCGNGKVYMVEFGIAGSHKNRKIEQEIRMRHWHINGGVEYAICYDWNDCYNFIKKIEIGK